MTAMRPTRYAPLALALTLAASLGACSSLSQAAGSGKVTPDEFRVVTKAPLSKPPEYNVRPTAPGEALPPTIATGSETFDTFGRDIGSSATAGERAFVRQAGAATVSRNMRALVDYEAADIVRKPRGFADRILFWRADAPVDPEDEVARSEARAILSATGGEDVTISRPTDRRFKLPGL